MTAASARPLTRIQSEKRDVILEAALDVFSTHGYRGATIDQISEAAGMSKPNLLYYFRGKEDIHKTLMQRLLDTWLAPLREFDNVGDPLGADRFDFLRVQEALGPAGNAAHARNEGLAASLARDAAPSAR